MTGISKLTPHFIEKFREVNQDRESFWPAAVALLESRDTVPGFDSTVTVTRPMRLVSLCSSKRRLSSSRRRLSSCRRSSLCFTLLSRPLIAFAWRRRFCAGVFAIKSTCTKLEPILTFFQREIARHCALRQRRSHSSRLALEAGICSNRSVREGFEPSVPF